MAAIISCARSRATAPVRLAGSADADCRRLLHGSLSLLSRNADRQDGACRLIEAAAPAVIVFAALRARRVGRRRSSVVPRRGRSSIVSRQSLDKDSAAALGQGQNVAPRGAPRTGVILLNWGTPASTSVSDVRTYIENLLWDDRVVDIEDPEAKRKVIEGMLRTRPAKSAEVYASIWDPRRGSPLLYHTEDLVAGLQRALGEEYEVCIGFQYSEPSAQTAMCLLTGLGVERIVLVPMFPHFAQATVGTILANSCRVAEDLGCTKRLQVIPPFYKHPGYLDAAVKLIGSYVGPSGDKVDHIVFSFHGVPASHCMSTDDSGRVCMRTLGCCERRCDDNRNCYRAQCFETARLLASELSVPEGRWSIAFSSRKTVRGNIQWTQPYTDELLPELARRGLRNVAVCTPSFTADCVETLAELGRDGKESFLHAGGENLLLIPCLNSSPAWVSRLAQMIRDYQSTGTGFWAM